MLGYADVIANQAKNDNEMVKNMKCPRDVNLSKTKVKR